VPLGAAALRAAAAGTAEGPQPLLQDATGGLVQHTRLTVLVEEPAHCARLAAATDVTRSYDILAVQPGSERAFATACTTLDVDIICFDLARRLPFRRVRGGACVRLPAARPSDTVARRRLRTPTVRAALARGVAFELCYAPALREPTARRQLFANALAVVRATGGRNIIVSSGAARAFELRGAYDVANLGSLFGLQPAAAKEAVGPRAHAVLQHAHERRALFVGRRLCALAAEAGGHGADAAAAWPPPPAAPLNLATTTLPSRDGASANDRDGFLAL
jgi:RNase P/RNase MRP subunit p30